MNIRGNLVKVKNKMENLRVDPTHFTAINSKALFTQQSLSLSLSL